MSKNGEYYSLTYLGYTFSLKNNHISKSIASSKMNVIKSRITKSFVNFCKNTDYNLLHDRIKFLTGNYTLYNRNTLLPIKVGIYFNYRQMDSDNINDLKELDTFYQKILHCKKGKLGTKIKLTNSQRNHLSKYSFAFGFKKHVNHCFTPKRIGKITSIWK